MQNPNRCEWMSQGKYGLMVHYLPNPIGETLNEKTKNFNNIVNNFNIDRFMSYIDECDPAWLIFTITQSFGFYSSSNEYLDNYASGFTSERDLVMEIAKEIKKRGKHFICYLPGCAGQCEKFESQYNLFKWNSKETVKKDFFESWKIFFEAYSLKFGKYCDGWWVDGCYDFYTNGFWDFSLWAEALRKGNPHSALAFSDGSFCIDSLYNITNENDYFPGEVTAIQQGKVRTDPGIFGIDYCTREGFAPTKSKVKFFVPKEKIIDGSLLHALVPFDTLWCLDFNDPAPWIYYPEEDLIKLVKDFNSVGGAVTLNAPIITKYGEIPKKSFEKLIAVKNAIRQ